MQAISVGTEAQGVIAIGQFATGVIAIGQSAVGVIAIGQIARGVIALGQVAVGLVAVGQVALGVGYAAGMIGLGGVAGGLIPLGVAGRWPLSAAVRLDVRRAVPALRAWTVPMVIGIGIAAWVIALGPLWDGLVGIGGVFHEPVR
ncbi:MAG: hypothetical protein OEX04_20770 [Acidimicrobiia bacterium]|nr:hypothetical protein [Acidimicrobiia bacterium]